MVSAEGTLPVGRRLAPLPPDVLGVPMSLSDSNPRKRSGGLTPDEARENGLWEVMYECVTAGMTKDQVAELYDWVKLDSLDAGEGWSPEDDL